MFWQKFLRDYFHFTRKDRVGILVLVLLVVLAYTLPLLFTSQPLPKYSLLLAADTLVSVGGQEQHDAGPKANRSWEEAHNLSPETFVFDPNTLPPEGWARLGLKPRTIRTIENYRSKGGRFRKPEDLQKIWGLPPDFWERVKDYVRLEQDEAAPEKPMVARTERQPFVRSPLDINGGDSALLETLPGIGATLASRIVSFREKLGGFHSVEQLGEVYGIRDSLFQKLRPLLILSGNVAKIPINSIPKGQLKMHPYFRWKLANAVVAYREQHGSFKALEDLKKVSLITDSLYQKILPYLKLE